MTREVRLTDKFLLDAVQQFRNERGPNGEPNAQDFFDHDLTTIRFVFGEMWDTLDLWQGHPRYRERHIQGTVAYMYYVVGQALPDLSIELIELGVEHEWPDDLI